MSRKPNNYNQIIKVLQELHSLYPNYNIGRHISTALDGYGDAWGMSDKEFLFALEKYKNQLDMDVPHSDDVENIIRQGMDLENILKDEDNGYDS